MNNEQKNIVSSIVLGLRTYMSKPNKDFPNSEEFSVLTCLDLESGEVVDEHIKSEVLKGFIADPFNLVGKNNQWPIIVFEYDWKKSKTAMFRKLVSVSATEYKATMSHNLPEQKTI